ncbi:hypothetical protein [Siminovitchia sp. 179-K 8D1 HS]|uniref:hypothetical protein n=1 Tax=Siminovitchia sp. 179-K 8D1 HS TaxID=3142385 RepID=UPI0039A35EC3
MKREWLTTGEMIDKLQVGEVAESSNHDKVTKSKDGGICFTSSGMNLILNTHFTNLRWRILPNFVSFEEAMKAIVKGKKVKFHIDNGKNFEIDHFSVGVMRIDATPLGKFSLQTLYNGKWAIEGDSE